MAHDLHVESLRWNETGDQRPQFDVSIFCIRELHCDLLMSLLYGNTTTDSESSEEEDGGVHFNGVNTETFDVSSAFSTRHTQKELRRETNSPYLPLSSFADFPV